IRSSEEQTGRHVRIVAMTAYAMKGDRDRCLAAGMDGYLAKPVRARELFESVESPDSLTRSRVAGLSPRLPAKGVFNKETALARVGGDVALLRELAELFLRESPALVEAVANAVGKGDVSLLKTAAHALKGSVDNFAAPGAFDAALRLETLGREGNLS